MEMEIRSLGNLELGGEIKQAKVGDGCDALSFIALFSFPVPVNQVPHGLDRIAASSPLQQCSIIS